MIEPKIEWHPLEPFLPSNAVLLMLGSFPPQQKRRSIDFYYPNMQNDMWRIFGYIFFDDKEYFILPNKKAFNKELIIDFLNNKGIAFAVYFKEVHATWVVFYIELEFLFVLIQELTLHQLALHVVNLHRC